MSAARLAHDAFLLNRLNTSQPACRALCSHAIGGDDLVASQDDALALLFNSILRHILRFRAVLQRLCSSGRQQHFSTLR